MFPSDGLGRLFFGLAALVACSWGVIVGINACGYGISWWWLAAGPAIAVAVFVGLMVLVIGALSKFT
jgi:ABC-type dipeptide/oligopeptide/nickel transport system permease subunit